MKTCIITFDQPLYLKSRDIIGAVNINVDMHVVIRLGGFHTILSFLGSIGFIMKQWTTRSISVYMAKTP